MQVVVLGAGYAGITVARRLEGQLPEDVNLVILDERETHLVQHLLHRVIRNRNLAAELQIPLSELFDRTDHRQATVEGVNPATGTVVLTDGSLSYDVAAVCLGARTAFYGLPGIAEHGMPLKRIDHAEAMRATLRH